MKLFKRAYNMNNNSTRITELLFASRGHIPMTPMTATELSGELIAAITSATPEEAFMALAVYGRAILEGATKSLNVEKPLLQKQLNEERGGLLH